MYWTISNSARVFVIINSLSYFCSMKSFTRLRSQDIRGLMYYPTPPLPGPKSRMWKEEGGACGQHPHHVRKQLLQKPTQRNNTPTVRGGKPLRKLRKWRVAAKPAWELTSRWRTFSRQNIKYGWAHGTWEHCTKRESYSKYCGRWLTIKWTYCVLVMLDGLTQRRDTPYSTPAAQTTYIEVESQSLWRER